MTLLIANWKLAPENYAKAESLAKATAKSAKTYKKSIETIVCAPSIYLMALSKALKTSLVLGGQTVSSFTDGGHTGDTAASMLRAAGATYCIVGHSEVRAAGVTNTDTNTQIHHLHSAKITPILCVGETERDAQGFYLSSIKDQIEMALAGVSAAQLKKLVIAYEPVWAIGKSAVREATPEECREMIIYIRKIIATLYDIKLATQITVIYGGSVNEQNADIFLSQGDAQGLLVGRVSTDPKRFAQLMKTIA